MHVGLLEDDMATQEMLLLVLQEEGYTAVNYGSAEGCLEQLGITGSAMTGQVLPLIDLLIVDLRLGGSVSGLDVIQHIRRTTYLRTLPIILMSAATFNEDDFDEIRQLHIEPIEKPFALDEMMGLIKRMLGNA